MNKNWLFLRGEFDERTEKSLADDDDMWIQLFDELLGINDFGNIYFNDFVSRYFNKTSPSQAIKYSDKCDITVGYFGGGRCGPDVKWVVFYRGGFEWQREIAKMATTAYKIYYGAGRRYVPDENIYNLILCDSEKQKKEILQRYPKSNTHLMIKPAARHFKPIQCKKEYDVCFIANETQGHFKGVQWVYDTVPKDLKVLHLGNFLQKYHAPDNVTRRHIPRIHMPEWISKCKMGIVPYWNQIDSCPRIIPEQLACGLPLVVADELNFWKKKYLGTTIENGYTTNKKYFWERICEAIFRYDNNMSYTFLDKNKYNQKKRTTKYYKENLSIPVAAKHINDLIESTI